MRLADHRVKLMARIAKNKRAHRRYRDLEYRLVDVTRRLINRELRDERKQRRA